MRATDSFTEHQLAAREWFDSWIPSFGGPTTYDLTAEIKELDGTDRSLPRVQAAAVATLSLHRPQFGLNPTR